MNLNHYGKNRSRLSSLAMSGAVLGFAALASRAPAQTCPVASGNIQPNSIAMDGSLTGSPFDWIKDNLTNTDPASICNGVANGLIFTASPIQTAAVGGKGHWN